MRNIEDTSLKEENKRHPLIIGLILDLISLILGSVCSNAWHSQYVLLPWQCEGPHDVAVGVHHMLGYGPCVGVPALGAGNVETITHILHTCDQDTAHQQDDAGHSVVELRDDALRLRLDNLM